MTALAKLLPRAWLGAGLQIGLSRRDVAIVYRGPGWRAKSALLAHPPAAGQGAMEASELVTRCAALLAGVDCANLPVRVVVADDWTRLFMAEPPRNAVRMQDLQAAAAMRFLALYGEAPAEWTLQGDWRVGAAFPVCAMPQALLAALDQIASDHKLRLVSVQPYFISAWNRYMPMLPMGAWFGAVQGDSLTLGVVADGSKRRLHAVRRIAIPADGHGLPWLQEQLARSALQLSLPAPPQVCLSGNRERFWSAPAALGTPTVLNLDQGDANSSAPAIVPVEVESSS